MSAFVQEQYKYDQHVGDPKWEKDIHEKLRPY